MQLEGEGIASSETESVKKKKEESKAMIVLGIHADVNLLWFLLCIILSENTTENFTREGRNDLQRQWLRRLLFIYGS